MRALSIIGLIFTTIFLFFLLIAATSNGNIDMEEFAPVGFMYGLYILAVTIVGTIVGGRRKKT
jgi:hypothetical protein